MLHFKENLTVVKNPPTLVVVILKVEGQAELGKCKSECFSFTLPIYLICRFKNL